MKKIFLIMLSVLVLSIFMVGCSSSSKPQAGNPEPGVGTGDTGSSVTPTETGNSDGSVPDAGLVKEVHIDMFDFGFNQDKVSIKKGDHVRLVVTSSNGTHGIMIPGLGLSTGKVSPGEQEVLEFVAKEAGTFDYFCNVPCGSGHKSMRGQLVVE